MTTAKTDERGGATGVTASGAEEQVVPLVEERLAVGKRRVETGRVRVRIATEAEEVSVREALRAERVEVERVPVGREVGAGEPVPGPREEEGGAVLVVPVLEEVLVVEKRLVVKEELRIRRATAVEPIERTVTLRRQRAEVERLPPDNDTAGAHAAGGSRANDTEQQEETDRP